MKRVMISLITIALVLTNCVVSFAATINETEVVGENQVFSEEKVKDNDGESNRLQTQQEGEEDSQNASLKTSEKKNQIGYNAHVQDIGWQGWKQEGQIAGTTGQKKRLEAIQIQIQNLKYSGNILYRTHIQNIGWQSWKENGEISGTTGEKLQIEAIEIKLTDELAEKYDLYYRVHSREFGWLGWARNGETAGTIGYAYRVEAIEIKLVDKNQFIPENDKESSKISFISYQTHVQDIGNQPYVLDGAVAGTTGKKLRVEAIRIKLKNLPDSAVDYRVHIQDQGWQEWKKNNELAGTTGEKKQIEAIEIKLNGEAAQKYDIYYRAHCQEFGWLDWAKNGETAGTAGYGYRMEAIQIQLVEKGASVFPEEGVAFKEKLVKYQVYIQGSGSQNVVSDGQVAGTEGKNLRMEGIKIALSSLPGSYVTYRSYIQDEGWQDWKSNMQLSGTTGQSKGIEVIQIQLSGSAASEYDIYYRVHVANLGWLGWTKNGEKAGSRFYNSSIEAIQIQMLKKGDHSIAIGEAYKEGIQNGIDVSEYNGNINWSKVKNSGISFAMLRCVKGSNPNSISVDAKFNQNIKGASDNGISVGVYRYSYADTASETRKEAMAVVNAIQNSGYRIQYPIAYDIEDENVQGDLSKAQLTEIIKIFKGIVENHGYKFMIYANKNWLDNKIDMKSFEDEDVWIARYRDYTPSLGHGYTGAGNVTIWQYSDRGTVPGIQGAVDMNIGYKEY
ncbi:GH25 family lysozyme [Lachnoclostridium sp. An181]|uniref:GH25 family lysozyme n=1 Tax=Lachnoclostridium sp. An181 TaxID=1965575 RepID=UPI000B378438|nr:GH25 family lysozyme [Lachnoclostridium sp. An181]OUP49753.1 hypothetical protein B5F18_06990 [Lachnoclostridium sp. An181]